MATQIQIKRGSTTPAGLTVGESAMNTSTNQIYLGGTGGTVLVGGEVTGGVDMGAGSAVSANRIPTQSGVYNYVRNSTVTSFNGLTGAVGGVTTSAANTFTALQSFSAGISAAGGVTFANAISVDSMKIGRGAGGVTSNVAIGGGLFQPVLSSNTTGYGNVGIGFDAIPYNTTGGENTAVGVGALEGNTAGNSNTGVGAYAAQNATSTYNNTAVGAYSLILANGSSNTAVGTNSLSSIVGDNNVALGNLAGRYRGTGTSSLTSGTGGIYIGHEARGSANATTNQIVIGTKALGLGSNTAVIGATAQISATIYGLVNAPSGISADGITVGGLITNISNDSGSAFNPIIDLYRNSASPASLDAIGQILFNGKDSAGNKQQYVNIHSAILDPSTTVESGQFHIETSTSGAMTEKMRIGAGGLIINNPQGNFHTTIYGQGDTAMFVAQGSTDRIGIGTSTPSVKLDVVGSIKASGGLSAGAGSFTGTLTGVTANFSGLVSASSGISASALTVSGGVTFSGNVYLGDAPTGVTADSNDFVRILSGTLNKSGFYQAYKLLAGNTSGIICVSPLLSNTAYTDSTTLEITIQYSNLVAGPSSNSPLFVHKLLVPISFSYNDSLNIGNYTESIVRYSSSYTPSTFTLSTSGDSRVTISTTSGFNDGKFNSGWGFRTTIQVH